MELSTVSVDSAASVDGIRLADLAEELPVGRSSLFELLKGLTIATSRGPGPDGKGRVAWVSSADADRLRAAAHSVNKGERKIADFAAQHTVSLSSLRTPQTLKKGAASTDSPDAAPFLARLEAAERAVSSGLGLTTAETAWILGVLPGSSPVTRGGITATRTSKNCWRLTKAALALLLFLPLASCSFEESEETRQNMAFIQCRDHVKSRLKAPSTANFPLLQFTVSMVSPLTYKVRSYVDAQNAFGAQIRSNYVCTIEKVKPEEDSADPRSWRLVELSID
jgi:hypothetical protein